MVQNWLDFDEFLNSHYPTLSIYQYGCLIVACIVHFRVYFSATLFFYNLFPPREICEAWNSTTSRSPAVNAPRVCHMEYKDSGLNIITQWNPEPLWVYVACSILSFTLGRLIFYLFLQKFNHRSLLILNVLADETIVTLSAFSLVYGFHAACTWVSHFLQGGQLFLVTSLVSDQVPRKVAVKLNPYLVALLPAAVLTVNLFAYALPQWNTWFMLSLLLGDAPALAIIILATVNSPRWYYHNKCELRGNDMMVKLAGENVDECQRIRDLMHCAHVQVKVELHVIDRLRDIWKQHREKRLHLFTIFTTSCLLCASYICFTCGGYAWLNSRIHLKVFLFSILDVLTIAATWLALWKQSLIPVDHRVMVVLNTALAFTWIVSIFLLQFAPSASIALQVFLYTSRVIILIDILCHRKYFHEKYSTWNIENEREICCTLVHLIYVVVTVFLILHSLLVFKTLLVVYVLVLLLTTSPLLLQWIHQWRREKNAAEPVDV